VRGFYKGPSVFDDEMHNCFRIRYVSRESRRCSQMLTNIMILDTPCALIIHIQLTPSSGSRRVKYHSTQWTLSDQQRSKHTTQNRSGRKVQTTRIIPTISLIEISKRSIRGSFTNPSSDLGDKQLFGRGRSNSSSEDFPIEFCVGVAGI
jgi:hypothetical protein